MEQNVNTEFREAAAYLVLKAGVSVLVQRDELWPEKKRAAEQLQPLNHTQNVVVHPYPSTFAFGLLTSTNKITINKSCEGY